MNQTYNMNDEHDVQRLLIMRNGIEDTDEDFVSLLKCFLNDFSLEGSSLLSQLKNQEVNKKIITSKSVCNFQSVSTD